LKRKLAIAAFFLVGAALTPANATTTIMLTTTLPSGTLGSSANLYLSGSGYTGTGNGYIIVNGWDDIFPSTTPAAPNYNSPAHTENLKVANGGLGLNNSVDNGQIGVTDGIVMNFANVATTFHGDSLSNITFNISKDNTGDATWMLYGMSNSNGSGTATLLDSGTTMSSGPVTYNTSALYNSYVLGLTNNDCSVDLSSVSITYSGTTTTNVPEPGTFVMAGMALLGLGVTMRKRARTN
jgi:hypothetical protein